VELSSAGRRKPVGEDYPSPELVRELADSRVSFVLSSDAHAPAEVGLAFGDLAASARAAGISEVVVFRGRRRDRVRL
jgi:histidinol-phosphatase (PHP family)